MKLFPVSELLTELDKDMEPEIKKLSEKFVKKIKEKKYLDKLIKSELDKRIDSPTSSEGISQKHTQEWAITCDDPKIDMGFYLDVHIYAKDNLFTEKKKKDNSAYLKTELVK